MRTMKDERKKEQERDGKSECERKTSIKPKAVVSIRFCAFNENIF